MELGPTPATGQSVAGQSVAASGLRLGTPASRWVLTAAILGSGVVFLDSTIVNSALPAIRRDLGGTLGAQQWIATGYLLTLGSLLVVGGSLGDRFGRRRMFVGGLIGFAITSVMCGAAPSLGWLIAGRFLKGVAGAALVPGSLAMISASFHPDDRAKAIGIWSGLASTSTAIGPFIGGWLIDSVSWRWVFLINPLLVSVPVFVAQRFVPETRNPDAADVDLVGGALLSLGLASVVYALIEGPADDWPRGPVTAAVVGLVAIAAFVVWEMRCPAPMVPLSLFASRQFSGANLTTFVIWGAIGAVFFLLTLRLQEDLGYSALEAGAATVPITVLVALLAPRGGALAQRIGPRVPLTIGALMIASGFALFTRVAPGETYWWAVLPGVVVFGFGLTLSIAPVSAAVLSAVDDRHAGIASAINNAVARVASLLVIAVLPAAAGIAPGQRSLGPGYITAMWSCAALAALGAVVAAATLTGGLRASRPGVT